MGTLAKKLSKKQKKQAEEQRAREEAARRAAAKKKQAAGQATARSRRGVPGPDAFENIKRREAPDLPPARGQGRSTRPANGQGRGQSNGRGGSAPGTGRAGANSRGQDTGAKATGPEKQKKKRKPLSPARRRRNRRIAGFVALVALIGGGIWFSMSVLFKIDGFVVEGESPYSEAEILAAFGYEAGGNMFGFDAKGSAKQLEQTLPYLETVRIQRKLPGTVVLHIIAAEERFSVPADGDIYAVLSSSLKVLRFQEGAPYGLTTLYGLTSLSLTPGLPLSIDAAAAGIEVAQSEQRKLESTSEPVPDDTEPEPDGYEATSNPDGEGEPGDGEGEPAATDEGGEGADQGTDGDTPQDEGAPQDEGIPEEGLPADMDEAPAVTGPAADVSATWQTTPAERLDAMQDMIAILAANGLLETSWINVADTLGLQFYWQDRVLVKLGTMSGMEEKLKAVVVMLTDRTQNTIGETERGTLDASSYPSTLEIWFRAE